MKVLIGCEKSGVVRDAFLEQGHDAWSCDLLPSETPSNRHIQDDVRYVLQSESWDLLMVAHPPCTRLCNSGSKWLYKVPPSRIPLGHTLDDMWAELEEGSKFFAEMWNADVPRVAVENPVMHKHAKKRIQQYSDIEFPWKATQTVQPWQFAEAEEGPDNVKKRTCFWLRDLPLLEATGNLDGSSARADIHNEGPSPQRAENRSRFFPGMANAMATQWGGHAIKTT